MFWKNWKKRKKSQDDENGSLKIGLFQKLAMKKLKRMDLKEQENLIKKALSPENIAKNKDKILGIMEQMKISGQLTEEQIRIVKEKLGL